MRAQKQPEPRPAYSNAGQGFLALDSEIELAAALIARTGRDLFAGTTDPSECKARARIQIVMNKLDAELMGSRTFAQVFESIYAEPLRAAKPTTTPKGEMSP